MFRLNDPRLTNHKRNFRDKTGAFIKLSFALMTFKDASLDVFLSSSYRTISVCRGSETKVPPKMVPTDTWKKEGIKNHKEKTVIGVRRDFSSFLVVLGTMIASSKRFQTQGAKITPNPQHGMLMLLRGCVELAHFN